MDRNSQPLVMERALALISLFIQGRITEPENEELDDWLLQSDYNQSLFETLTHPDNLNGLQRMIDISNTDHFCVGVPYDEEIITALVVRTEENRYQVWINGEHKFTLATRVLQRSEVDWFVVEENKYVPYAEHIGREIEKHFM